MALDNTELAWEVRTAGSDNNGGGWSNRFGSGIDRSQQNGAFATLTAASTVNAVTSVVDVALGDYTVVAGDLGNILQVTGGTATAGFYEIIVVDVPNNRWQVDRLLGVAGQTVVGAMGGALASPGMAGGPLVAGNIIWVKAGTYTISSTTANVSGGPLTMGQGLSGRMPTRVWGYNTARGDFGTLPLLQVAGAGVTNITVVNFTGIGQVVNLAIDGQSKVGIRGIALALFSSAYFCKVSNCTNIGLKVNGTNAAALRCEVTGCTTQPAMEQGASTNSWGCVSHDNSVTGLLIAGDTFTVERGLFVANSGGTSDGIDATGKDGLIADCVAANNGRHGINGAGDADGGQLIVNTVSYGNGGWGLNTSTLWTMPFVLNCAFGNNASGAFNATNVTALNAIGTVTLTADPFTNSGAGDFSLNMAAGGGAACRTAGYPGLFPAGTTTGYVDIGGVQHRRATRLIIPPW